MEQNKEEQNVVLEKSEKSWWLTAIVGILFGYLGAHRFYVGKWESGLLYLFTAGLLGIGWIIDLVTVCCMKFTDSKNRVVKIN